MDNKILIKILWGTTLSFLGLAIIPYIIKFGDSNISNDPEKWGTFGDYLGGILNPLIGILNLIVLTYLSVNLVKEENERNKFTLQELAKPYGEFDFIKKIDSLTIKFLNIGLGPLIVNEVIIISPNNIQYINFRQILNDFHSLPENRSFAGITYEFHTFSLSNNHAAIGKDSNVLLFRCENISPVIYCENFITSLKEFMTNYQIQIKYSDMYERSFNTKIESIFYN